MLHASVQLFATACTTVTAATDTAAITAAAANATAACMRAYRYQSWQAQEALVLHM